MSFIPGNTGVASTFPDGFALGDGTATAPTLRFQDTQTGFYRAGVNSFGFASAGVQTGSVSAIGGWTFGSATGGNVIHTINGVTLNLTPQTGTSSSRFVIYNTGGGATLGVESSTGGSIITGSAAYSLSLKSDSGINFAANGTSTLHGSVSSAGVWTFGPASGGGLSHTVRSGASTALTIESTGATDVVFKMRANAVDRWEHRYEIAASKYTFKHASTALGEVSEAGNWRFGPDPSILVGGGVNHIMTSVSPADDSAGTLFLRSSNALGSNVGAMLALGGYYNATQTFTFGAIAGRKENATSGNVAGYLSFLTTTSGGVSTERGRLDSNGSWTLGTSTIGVVAHNAYSGNTGTADGNAVFCFRSTSSSASQNYIQFFISNTIGGGGVRRNGSGVDCIFFSGSDRRIKENIQPIESQLAKVNQVKVRRYDLKSGGSGVGVIAQELVAIYPDKVVTSDDGIGDSLPEGTQPWSVNHGWDYELIAAIQELNSKLEAAEARIAALEGATTP